MISTAKDVQSHFQTLQCSHPFILQHQKRDSHVMFYVDLCGGNRRRANDVRIHATVQNPSVFKT